MKHFAAILRRSEELQRAEGVRHAMACGWLRLAGEQLSAPLDAEHIVTIGDPRDHALLLAALEKERAAGRYDLSQTDDRHWVRTVSEYIWKARRVRMAWRFMNRDRRVCNVLFSRAIDLADGGQFGAEKGQCPMPVHRHDRRRLGGQAVQLSGTKPRCGFSPSPPYRH